MFRRKRGNSRYRATALESIIFLLCFIHEYLLVFLVFFMVENGRLYAGLDLRMD